MLALSHSIILNLIRQKNIKIDRCRLILVYHEKVDVWITFTWYYKVYLLFPIHYNYFNITISLINFWYMRLYYELDKSINSETGNKIRFVIFNFLYFF